MIMKMSVILFVAVSFVMINPVAYYVNGIRVIGLHDDLIDELLLAYNVTTGN